MTGTQVAVGVVSIVPVDVELAVVRIPVDVRRVAMGVAGAQNLPSSLSNTTDDIFILSVAPVVSGAMCSGLQTRPEDDKQFPKYFLANHCPVLKTRLVILARLNYTKRAPTLQMGALYSHLTHACPELGPRLTLVEVSRERAKDKRNKGYPPSLKLRWN